MGASVNLQEEGVGLQFDGNGTVTVRLDDKEETIPSSEVDNSEMYQEAFQRVANAASAEIGVKHKAWSWPLICRRYLPIVTLLSVVLFVVWKPRHSQARGATCPTTSLDRENS